MPDVAINDVTMYYEISGTGNPLLLIAGFASDSQSWASLVPILSANHQLIMPDNRAVGRTLPADAGTSVEQMAADCIGLLDALGHEKIDVLGHSMGSTVALYLAAHHPERINRVVVAACGQLHNSRVNALIDTLVALREAGAPEDLWYANLFHWLFAPGFFDDPSTVNEAIRLSREYPYKQSIRAMRAQANAIGLFQHDDMLENITAPVLCLHGANDLLFPPADTIRYLLPLKGIQTEIIPNAGHSLHWDATEIFAGHVMTFLENA